MLRDKKDFKALFVISALSVLLVAGTQFVDVAKANPWRFVTFGSAIPGTTPPLITVYSPLNNSVCSSTVPFSLHISKPLLPAPFDSTYNGLINIYIELDGRVVSSYYCNQYGGSGALGGAQAGLPEFNYFSNLTLAEGKHTINVDTVGMAFAPSGAFNVESKSTVYFSTDPNMPPTSTIVPTVNTSLPPLPPTTVSTISMPIEYINYTVSTINGSLWATVDGTYPLHFSSDMVGYQLSMEYPTPPGTTSDIKITADGQPVSWSNLTQTNPEFTHYTFLGRWPIIICTIQPNSPDLLLTIHYQHPIFQLNGSYAFLYDLNISPYLSDSSNGSIAYFNVHFEPETSNIHVYTVSGDSSVQRNDTKTPLYFAANQDNGTQTLTFNVTSSLSKPVPGDELFLFNDSTGQVPEFPSWIILTALMIIGVLTTAAIKRNKFGNDAGCGN